MPRWKNIYEDPWRDAVRAWLFRGKPESISLPPPTLSYPWPLSRTEETVWEEAGRPIYCWVNKLCPHHQDTDSISLILQVSLIFSHMISQAFLNFSEWHLNIISHGIQSWCHCWVEQSGKWALISAPQQCPEASGLLPESRGVVLWGPKGRKQDQI